MNSIYSYSDRLGHIVVGQPAGNGEPINCEWGKVYIAYYDNTWGEWLINMYRYLGTGNQSSIRLS